ncbi:MAG: phosphate uptake regulator PhoU [Microbacteriaceae bacterium]|nr:phosphate uptake regulator PhoU [Microbacteriaceae bacterium]
MGDCVEYIARNLRDFGDLPSENPAIWTILKDLSDKSNMIMERSVSALLSGDAVAAAGIPELDNIVDALQEQAHDMVLRELGKGLEPETGLHLVACANKFESIADIACHIAETVVFIVQAKRIRHGLVDGRPPASLHE